MRALKSLVKEGLLAKDAEIPCRVMAADEDAAEVSLTENTLRLAMHPDDQFVAFQQLVETGRSMEDVAARAGVLVDLPERVGVLLVAEPAGVLGALRVDRWDCLRVPADAAGAHRAAAGGDAAPVREGVRAVAALRARRGELVRGATGW